MNRFVSELLLCVLMASDLLFDTFDFAMTCVCNYCLLMTIIRWSYGESKMNCFASDAHFVVAVCTFFQASAAWYCRCYVASSSISESATSWVYTG